MRERYNFPHATELIIPGTPLPPPCEGQFHQKVRSPQMWGKYC